MKKYLFIIFLFKCLMAMPDSAPDPMNSDDMNAAPADPMNAPVDAMNATSDDTMNVVPDDAMNAVPAADTMNAAPVDTMNVAPAPAMDTQVQNVSQPAMTAPMPDQQPPQPANYDQLKWPDSIELKEGQGDIVPSDDPKIIELSKKASQLADQLKNLANKLKETADKVNQEFTRINILLDDFYQKIGFEEGKVAAMFK